MSETFEYSGKDILESLKGAHNYNHDIFCLIQKPLKPHFRVLEFGCGMGEFCNRLSHLQITGLELDPSLHEDMEINMVSHLHELPDTAFDYIYSINVLEHIEDDAAVVQEMSTKLTDKGQLFVLVPAFPLLYSAFDQRVDHVRRYRKRELYQLFADNGFVVDWIKYFDFAGFFAGLLYKGWDNSGHIDDKSLIIYDRFVFPVSRWLDRITAGKLLGKNLILLAHKKGPPP